MSLYEKSLQTIELPAVLELLAGKAVSDGAKALARALRPAGEMGMVRERQSETTCAKTMMETKGSPSFSGLKDVRPALARADMGGMLSTRELLDIAGVLFCTRAVASYAAGRGDNGCLKRFFTALSPNRFLEEKITTSITGEEEIADGASPELADIRRKMRAASARARDALQKIITAPSYAKVLQEPIITQRGGRFVVPVRAEKRGDLPGLVHDVSSSGATLFVEPMGVVKANNELRELGGKEKAEIERILMELSAECAAARSGIDSSYSVLTQLDLIFAKAELSYDLNCGEPILTEDRLILKKARHPLLPKGTAVPIDVTLGGDYDAIVITGPNTGGKTVTLKTLGLMCAMAGCGLHIPAGDGSAVPVLKNILADIGDEQSIEQSLSTFSSHMVNIVAILQECGPGSMVLLDEVGAGTDPTEGAALAISILEYARQAGALLAATTHYAELKVYATNTQGVVNASCEFDVQTLRPTYRLLVGIPGKSNAFAISRRLGLPESIIEDAGRRIDAGSSDFERTIERLEAQRAGGCGEGRAAAPGAGGAPGEGGAEGPPGRGAHHQGGPGRRRRGIPPDRPGAGHGPGGAGPPEDQRGPGGAAPQAEPGGGVRPQPGGDPPCPAAQGPQPAHPGRGHGGAGFHRLPGGGHRRQSQRHPEPAGGHHEADGEAGGRGPGGAAGEEKALGRRGGRSGAAHRLRFQGAGYPRHDGRRGGAGRGAVFGRRVRRSATDRHDHPRKGDRRPPQFRPAAAQTQPSGEGLPAGPIWRRRDGRNCC